MYLPEDAEVFTARGRKIAIIYRKMPAGVDDEWGITVKDNGLYTVTVNADISLLTQHHVLGHELAHIFCGHFETFGMDPNQREEEANKKAWEYYNAYIEGRL